MSTTLCLHTGGRLVTESELKAVKTPEATKTWFPVAHHDVLTNAIDTLTDAGFTVKEKKLALARNDARMFATLDIATALAAGVSLAVGVRNSIDKSFPLGFCAGNRVFVCDNLAFSAELLVKRKHTRFGHTRFKEAIAQAVKGLAAFRVQEAARIELLARRELGKHEADSLILDGFTREIISHRQLPEVVRQWREPSFEDFQPRTAWSLFNAFTYAIRGLATSNPQRHASLTMSLYGLLLPDAPPVENAVAA